MEFLHARARFAATAHAYVHVYARTFPWHMHVYMYIPGASFGLVDSVLDPQCVLTMERRPNVIVQPGDGPRSVTVQVLPQGPVVNSITNAQGKTVRDSYLCSFQGL